MTPFFQRNLLKGISISLFAGVLYSFNKIVPAMGSRLQHIELFAISLMILLSLIIMLLWSVFGAFGGLISFLTAMIFLYRPITDLNPYYYTILIIAFFLSSFVGHYVSKRINVSNQQYTVSREKIQEDTNLIRNHLKNRILEVSATGEKVGSLLKIKNIADKLSLTLSFGEIMKIVADETLKLFKDESRVLLFIAEEPSKELNLVHTAKDKKRKPFKSKTGGIFDRWVLKNMKSLLVKDISKDFRFSVTGDERKDDTRSLIIKPLIMESSVMGILRVDNTQEAAFGQHELRILDIIGELAAVAFENSRLYKQTEELAIKDSLTELYVHRYFMERLDEEVKRALRSDGSFSLLMLDIDEFKEFNDKYGHISGDVILKNIGAILRSKASAGDIVARYGGEEFVFLALNCEREKAIELAEQIRVEIQNTPVILRRKKCAVTVSIGVAFFPEDAKLREDIVWEADRYLYKAKAKGKNVVCSK